ncbi:extracellular solute-binding protein family 5 [Denitrovibrio acetiphilus DSM 12809]|uniref:Extracellular solute-binding protein family 5 n=2 Tax=Denitrovibrio TaxID=117999 RepID=D4H6N4_DENA2|nr:extracellular solute-binding protein family 5 [Denitrovibrio acetiphilus DSM 12809]
MKRLILFAVLALLPFQTVYAEMTKTHVYSLIGEAKYGAEFKHFDYVNPDAPKGGTLRMAFSGTYDSFNNFAIKGKSVVGIGYIYDTLMESSDDEPSSYYGLLAESLEYPDDYSSVIFTLRKNAKWNDGKPVTADDVVFSFYEITKVSPFYSNYFKLVKKVEALDRYRVRFEFDETQTSFEMPLIAGQLTIIPKHFWKDKDLSRGGLENIPLGSGPYRIAGYEAGKNVVYERVPDYWGADVPVNVGRYNFDRIVYEYFRDQTVAFEAFKAGHYDLRNESAGKRWFKGYTGKYFDMGLIKKMEVPHKKPMGIAGIFMNTSSEFLSDINLRKALTYVYDYDWINQNILYGQNVRHTSFFSNTEMMADGEATEKELDLLRSLGADAEKFRQQVEIYKTNGDGNNRAGLMKAVELLTSAGYYYKDGKMYTPDGRYVSLEILTSSKTLEKQLMPLKQGLERIGIDMFLRYVDSSQYVSKVRSKDYMMIYSRVKQSFSPGNEQRNMWASLSAEEEGSRNYAKIKDPLIDKLVDHLINAKDRESLKIAARALDRVLLNGYYVIPTGYSDRYRIAYWDKFDRPEKMPEYSLGFSSWWIVPEKAAEIAKRVNR